MVSRSRSMVETTRKTENSYRAEAVMPPARNGIAYWFSHGPFVAIGPRGLARKYGSRGSEVSHLIGYTFHDQPP